LGTTSNAEEKGTSVGSRNAISRIYEG
jgi:hypothetical protein